MYDQNSSSIQRCCNFFVLYTLFRRSRFYFNLDLHDRFANLCFRILFSALPRIYDGDFLLKQWLKSINYTAQKMKFSIKDFFSKCDQIRSLLRI